MNVKGILSFPSIFKAKRVANIPDSVPKFGLCLLFPPSDPELVKLKAEFDKVKLEAYPDGTVPRTHTLCLQPYADKYDAGKDYYDHKLAQEGWWVFSCTSPEDNKPPVVDMSHEFIVDPGSELVKAGMVVVVNLAMGFYNKGGAGIGGWLNGVMATGELGSLGLLDNKPTVEQMFSEYENMPEAHVTAGTTAPAPPAPTAPPPAPGKQMTAAAEFTYEQYIAANWTDEMLVQYGLMVG